MGLIFSSLATTAFDYALCAGCSFFSCLLNATLSSATRFGHVLIIFVTFLVAIVVGLGYADKLNGYAAATKLNLSENCSLANVDECIYRQLVYRASFSLVLLFSLLALSTYYSDYVNRSLWILKFMAALGGFVGFWWLDNSFFNGWAEAARVISFFWLLIQGLLFLDLAHDSHDLLMAAADDAERETGDSRSYYVVYLLLSLLFLSCAIVGIVFLYLTYGGCTTGLWFTSVTLVVGVILTVISLLNVVNKGLLTPCLMWSYATFICWYALLSSPDVTCNKVILLYTCLLHCFSVRYPLLTISSLVLICNALYTFYIIPFCPAHTSTPSQHIT